jgi:hypothetical protein
VEELHNWNQLVWQVAWIIANIEYGRVRDVKQLESVLKPERQITLLGVEGTQIKARWSNRTVFTIQDLEFVDQEKEKVERAERDKAHGGIVEEFAPVQMYYAQAAVQQPLAPLQGQWQLYPAPAEPNVAHPAVAQGQGVNLGIAAQGQGINHQGVPAVDEDPVYHYNDPRLRR